MPAFRQILEERGYAEHPSPSGPELDARFCKQGQFVEIMFLQEQADGGAWAGGDQGSSGGSFQSL